MFKKLVIVMVPERKKKTNTKRKRTREKERERERDREREKEREREREKKERENEREKQRGSEEGAFVCCFFQLWGNNHKARPGIANFSPALATCKYAKPDVLCAGLSTR